MVTINTLLTDAIIDTGKYGPADSGSIESADLAHALRVANRMIGRWATKHLLIPYTTSENFAGSGSASYTMGAAGTASASRASRIISAYVNDGSTDYPIKIIDQRRYNNISDKTSAGRPEILFYDPVYAVGVIYLWLVPDAGYTIYIESEKSLHSALSLGDTVSLSIEYEEAIVLNLRNRIASSFGMPVSNEWKYEAEESLNDIKILNLGNRQETMDMPPEFGGQRMSYNINSG